MRRTISTVLIPRVFRTISPYRRILPVVILVIAGLAGCRREYSGTLDPPLTAPYLYQAQIGVSLVDLDTSSASVVKQISPGTYEITDSLSAVVLDPVSGDDITSCTYSVTSPGISTPFLTGNLNRISVSSNQANFSTKFAFLVRRDQIGPYIIEIDASGQAGYVANARRVTLSIIRNDARPVISNLLAPDTLVRPQSGSRMVRLAISASDSDGLGDIVKVFFRSINSTSPDFEQPMFDDGNLAVDGDSVAGDGRYARLLPLDSTATAGIKEFRFFARDKAGAVSDSIVHYIVIQ